ncbi:MAG TPA: hypothetical protein VF331_13365, partial [Polyangiales bacterium]
FPGSCPITASGRGLPKREHKELRPLVEPHFGILCEAALKRRSDHVTNVGARRLFDRLGGVFTHGVRSG